MNITKKILTFTLIGLPVALFAGQFDFETHLSKTHYYGFQTGYSMIKYPSKSTNKTGFPVPISADYGVRFKMDDRVYLGYELGVGYVGYHSFKVNQMSASQNLFQGDILAVLNLFINPYFELHTKAGFAVQANYFTGNSVYAPNFTFGLGMGIYVDSEMKTVYSLRDVCTYSTTSLLRCWPWDFSERLLLLQQLP